MSAKEEFAKEFAKKTSCGTNLSGCWYAGQPSNLASSSKILLRCFS